MAEIPEEDGKERLELSREEMRDLGYRIVDRLVERFAGLSDLPVSGWGTREELEARFREAAPEKPSDPAAVLERLDRDLLPFFMPISHPRFFAFVPGPSNFVGAMADALAAGLNPFVGTWFAGSGPAEIELVTIDWLRQLCGLPEEAGGLFVSGGSMANLTALDVAREVREGRDRGSSTSPTRPTPRWSAPCASSASGRRRSARSPRTRSTGCPPPSWSGRSPPTAPPGGCPSAWWPTPAPRTPARSIPSPSCAEVCQREGLWLHADGAYGAAAVLCERGRQALAGLERVDSLSLDPHKWLFQPMEIGCVLLRDRRLLRDTYSIHPEYLQDVHRDQEAVNFCDYGVQLTRSFRALKLWMSFQVFGMEAFRAAVDRGFDLAERAEAILRQSPAWEVTTPARMGVVSFRYWLPGLSEETLDGVQQGIVDGLRADGFALLTSTRLRGRTALRLCTINPRTTDGDLRQTIERMAELGQGLTRGAS